MKHIRTCLKSNDRLTRVDENRSSAKEMIFLDPTITKQTIIGFGGAFTEASAYNLSRISKENRKKAIEAYFDPEKGIGYTIGRVSIHGCDFSLGSYLYIDDYDNTLDSFDVSRDQPIIDLINDSSKIAHQNIQILASPWTPPFWMKDNHSPIRGGHLLPEFYPTWAKYYVKFIDAYQKKGVDIFALTVQNEPAAVQRWDSCIYSAEQERDFVKTLGPVLKASYPDVKLLIWDHNRDVMVERAKVVYDDQEASKYVWGTAFHWYDNEQFQNVAKHQELFPDKHLLFTEGCQENGPHFNEYPVGERYGRNMINDLRNYTEGYIDWNLFLDDTGGPNHVNNLCSSPAMLKIFHEELVLNPSYYYVGQFSKYIKPGAKQIASSGTREVIYVAFMNPDGSYVVVVQNEQEVDINIQFDLNGKTYTKGILAHSINTFII